MHTDEAKNCPHFNKKASVHHCPYSGSKCPYVKEGHHTKCPAENCPHYEELKKGNLENLNFDSDACPLKDKCPYYKNVQKNHDTLLSCPMAAKDAAGCPYKVYSTSTKVKTKTDDTSEAPVSGHDEL
jgi:hypothetical protein